MPVATGKLFLVAGSRSARGPYAKTAGRRADILLAAGEAFAETGYAATSLRDIAARAGITHAGLLHHFSGKEELLIAHLEQRDAASKERATRLFPDGPADPAEVARFVGDLMRARLAEPEMVRLWAELTVAASRPAHPAHRHVVERYARERAELAAAPGVGEATAAVWLAVMDGLQVQWLLDPGLDVAAAAEDTIRLLLTGAR
jgi:AcrR family transcriptional regulator